jgi:RNA polymerase primary sigma factor
MGSTTLEGTAADARPAGLLEAEQERRLLRAIAEAGQARERLATLGPTPAERARLERVVAAGSRARSALVAANQGLVRSVARRYERRGLPLDDLMQEGNLGLLRAIERFDLGRGCRFSTYAVWRIREAILEAVERDGSLIRRPIGPDRPGDGLSRAPDRSSGQIVDAPLSLESLLGSTELTLGDVLADPSADLGATLERLADRHEVARAVATLPALHRRLVVLRYGLDGRPARRLRQVAAALDMSPERARRVEAAALRMLRERAPREPAA